MMLWSERGAKGHGIKRVRMAGYGLDIGAVVEVGLFGITSFSKHFFWMICYITALNIPDLSFGRQCLPWKHGKGPGGVCQRKEKKARWILL